MLTDATPGTARPTERLLWLVEEYGKTCHAIGWNRGRYDQEAAPVALREQRDNALAGIERLAREMDRASDAAGG